MAVKTEKDYFRISYATHCRYRYRRNFFWQFREGYIANRYDLGHHSYVIADTDTEKYYFQSVSATKLEKQ